MAYQTLVRPQLEYASAVLDSHTKKRPTKLRWSKGEEQPAGPQMIGTGQLVSHHCCTS